MKIVIAGGREEADFLLNRLLLEKNSLTVINEDRACCEHLAAAYERASVISGDPCKEYMMEEAGVRGYDMIIALRDKDADNLAICQMAKQLFGIKQAVCIVHNPKNVEVFEQLGVDKAISATYMLAHYVNPAFV